MKTEVAMKSLKRQRTQTSACMKAICHRTANPFTQRKQVGSILVEVVIGG